MTRLFKDRRWQKMLATGVLVALIQYLQVGCSSLDSSEPRRKNRPAVVAEPVRDGALAGSPIVSTLNGENRVALIEDGYEALLARVHLIRQARHSIDIQTFIWTGDHCGKLIIRELIAASRRGVRVRLLVDHFGAHKDVDDVAYLTTIDPDFQIKVYRPTLKKLDASLLDQLVAMSYSFRDSNQRMHNKVLLVDGAIMITGGRNYEDTYFNHSPRMNFRDRDVIVSGPVLGAARASFADFWNYRHSVDCDRLQDVAMARQSDEKMATVARDHEVAPAFFHRVGRAANDRFARRLASRMREVRSIEWLADPPGKNRATHLRGSGRSSRRLKEVLSGAEEEVIIQTPYLVLGRKSLRFFKALRKEKPLLPIAISTNSFASTDNILTYGANYRLRDAYLNECGFQIYEFKAHPGDMKRILSQYPDLVRQARREGRPEKEPFICLHPKSLVVDRQIAYVGSYNLDPRSRNLNTEAGVLIDEAWFAGALRREILRDTAPQNSLVIAPRKFPLGLKSLNELTGEFSSKVLPIDLWPLKNTSSFELREGKKPVPFRHPDFYENYEDEGSFPGAVREGPLKEIVTRLFKALGKPVTPLL